MIEGGQNIFDAAVTEEKPKDNGTETETAASSTGSSETSTGQDGDKVEEVPKDLNNKTALHKDARFKRVIEERNRERAEKRELMERLDRLEKGNRPEAKPTATTKPAWFAKYFGDDQEAWDGFQQMTKIDSEAIKAEALAELKREQETSSKESQRWQSWVNEQVETLEDEGESFEKNALFKVMDEYRPTDDEGNLDFRRGLELLRYKEANKSSDIEAKRKAGSMATGTKKSGAEPTKRNVVTASDIRKMRLTGEI